MTGQIRCRWLDDFPNLIVTRTFSKMYALAGLRVGYAVSHPQVAELLNRVRQPFNVNSLAQIAARAALDDAEHVTPFQAVECAWTHSAENRSECDWAGGSCLRLAISFWPIPAVRRSPGTKSCCVPGSSSGQWPITDCRIICASPSDVPEQNERLLSALSSLMAGKVPAA